MKNKILPACFLIVMCVIVNGATNDSSPAILVTAFPLQGDAVSAGRVAEHIDFSGAGGSPVASVLESSSSVSVSERGGSDVQADLSIRGSTFQQVLLMLDGLPVSDPQTAHHNMDIPYPASALESVTVIPGAGTALLGPAAFAGAVDMTLRQPQANRYYFSAGGGSFSTWNTELSADRVFGGGSFNAGFRVSESDGFMDGADYSIWSGWGSVFLDSESANLRISAGHVDKDFGAQDFYAAYPSRELTTATIIDIAPAVDLPADWVLKMILRYRAHDDDFILFRDEPARYRNIHEVESYNGRMQFISPVTSIGRIALGAEYSDARLDSSSLGDRSARVSSAFTQYRIVRGPLSLDAGARIDENKDWGTEFSPSIGVSLEVVDNIAVYGSAARGVRPPSFTELYYQDPKNRGNAELVPEEAWGYEAGIDIGMGEKTGIVLGVFRRDAEDLIDWTRSSDDEVWLAGNIGEAVFDGAELRLRHGGEFYKGNVFVQVMDVDADNGGLQSKYALNVPDYDLGFSGRCSFPSGTVIDGSLRYREIPELDNYTLVDLRIAQAVGRGLVCYVKGRNLLDEDYEEIPGVPTSGSYAEAGVEIPW